MFSNNNHKCDTIKDKDIIRDIGSRFVFNGGISNFKVSDKNLLNKSHIEISIIYFEKSLFLIIFRHNEKI